jgi:hypothetical protein
VPRAFRLLTQRENFHWTWQVANQSRLVMWWWWWYSDGREKASQGEPDAQDSKFFRLLKIFKRESCLNLNDVTKNKMNKWCILLDDTRYWDLIPVPLYHEVSDTAWLQAPETYRISRLIRRSLELARYFCGFKNLQLLVLGRWVYLGTSPAWRLEPYFQRREPKINIISHWKFI